MADHGATLSSYFIYDVFLSFRGSTRHGFTDHLYRALRERGIITFRDDENLRVGDRIRPTFLEAIEGSRMSIVVLCQNYASSTWCLDELVQIMKCSNQGTVRPVLPIFYHVEPSVVRHQTKQYNKHMKKRENRYGKESQEVKAWRLALSEICGLSGKQCMKNSYESKIIKKIVEEISEKLPPEPLLIRHPIGFDSQFEVVESLLDIKDHDTLCMLVIYGDGETNKATFARELYNKFRHQFEASSFLANVCEKSKESINGLEDLQKILLSEMRMKTKTKIGSTLAGSFETRQKLCSKRFLLVLDDVDSTEQLDSLIGEGDWFGSGSRIIITTRDVDVLDKYVSNGVKIMKYCNDKGEFEGMEGIKSNHKLKRDIEEDVVGFVNTFNDIIKQLKEEDSCTNVISIIGMGGLGKTTLARKIYNNNEVKKLFSCCAWAIVSKDYKARELLLSLLHCLKSFDTNAYKDSSEEELKNKVREYLNKNKYLIVLDDLWESEVWDEVESLFPNNKNGNRILITSRNDEVANCTGSKSHYLPFLDKNESWELFCKKVFRGAKCPNTLDPIGRSMVEKCRGLPLAIVTLEGIVTKKKRLQNEWLRIKRHVIWHLANNDKSKVMDVLKLSYDSLPQRLKPCYLYFGMFPEDYYEVPVRRLFQLWIAEGFIQQEEIGISNTPELEYIAEEYLDELVYRNLVQVVEKRSEGGVKKCRIHDLLRELCISKSKADMGLEIRTDTKTSSNGKSCRLSLRCSGGDIHSLMRFGDRDTFSPWNIDLKDYNSARVLDFGRWSFHLSIPSNSNMFIHLRYLRINIFFQNFLHWICTFANLETLDIVVFRCYIPSGIWKLKQLRHLHVSTHDIDIVHIDTLGEDCLPNLQTLQIVDIDPGIMSLMDNKRFPKLRKLGLQLRTHSYGLPSVREQLQNLHNLNNLYTLKLFRTSDIPLRPDAFPSNLTKITIQMGGLHRFNYDCMATLGRLINLQVLKLDTETLGNCGSICCVAREFRKLEVFQMRKMSVKMWTLVKGAMPCLQHLVIHECYFLDELPQQLWSLTTLQDVLVVQPTSALRESLRYVKPENGCELIIEED